VTRGKDLLLVANAIGDACSSRVPRPIIEAHADWYTAGESLVFDSEEVEILRVEENRTMAFTGCATRPHMTLQFPQQKEQGLVVDYHMALSSKRIPT
jgi:hypothetical protein